MNAPQNFFRLSSGFRKDFCASSRQSCARSERECSSGPVEKSGAALIIALSRNSDNPTCGFDVALVYTT